MISLDHVRELYEKPLLLLLSDANRIHSETHGIEDIQLCTLLSVKTGGCPEDCAYCPQSARYATSVNAQKLLDHATVMEAASRAKAAGSSRFCMGAAWREVRDGKQFDAVLEMVRDVKALGMEVCTTLGMVNEDQARRLKEAGLTAYNHNLDTSESFYGSVIHTRSFDDRLKTLHSIQSNGISLCCGGIIGMGEGADDRISFLHTLANLDPQPESVPINALVPVEGTPMERMPPLDPLEFVRMIACARILIPNARVRLSAGRLSLSREAQTLAFLAGANSIFTGEKLLTTANPGTDADSELLTALGVKPAVPYSAEFSLTS